MDKLKLANVVKANAAAAGGLRAYARRLGVYLGTVQGWVEGRSIPSVENLVKIAADAGYSVEELVEYLCGTTPSPTVEAKQQVLKYIRSLTKEELIDIVNEATKILAGV